MRHLKANRKFDRDKNQRRMLKRSLVRSLVLKGHIKTTEARAKEIRPLIEKMVTRANKGNLLSRRILELYLMSLCSWPYPELKATTQPLLQSCVHAASMCRPFW